MKAITRRKLAGLAGVCALAGAVTWMTRARDDGSLDETDQRSSSTPAFVDGRHLPVPSSVPPVPVQIESVMRTWREAILAREPEAVLDCDRIFSDEPERYGVALVASAQSDPDQRVRAFSTRVLGRIGNPQWGSVFEALLADKSPFVRQNAAWALGRLGNRQSVPQLERIRREDRADNVRNAAAKAIATLSGSPVTAPRGGP